MGVANIYRKLAQILDDSNAALVDRNLNEVVNFNNILSEINKLGTINRLPYLLRKEIIEIAIEDLGNITSFSRYILNECRDIEKVSIPDSVTSIDNNAFSECEKFKDLYIYSTTPPKITGNNLFNKIPTIHVPIGSGDAYKSATNWSYYGSNIIEDIKIE